MYQAGTLSGNPLAMVAGIKTLEILDRPGTYEHLDKVTGQLIEGILQAGRDAGHEICGGHIRGESCCSHPRGAVKTLQTIEVTILDGCCTVRG